MRERRKAKRIQTEGAVVARVKSTHEARVLDISPFGAQVQLRAALRPGVECDVVVPVHDGELRLRAMVRRCRVAAVIDGELENGGAPMAYRAGLEFVRCSQQEAERIRATYGGRDERPPAPRRRTGPIRIKVNPDALKGGGDD